MPGPALFVHPSKQARVFSKNRKKETVFYTTKNHFDGKEGYRSEHSLTHLNLGNCHMLNGVIHVCFGGRTN
jgi:mannose/fructose/N-acetylgalactosamine-specific phosphotransferase system component IIB